MTYRGRVRNGVIVLDPPATLPEGAEVEVVSSEENHDHDMHGAPDAPSSSTDESIPTLYERMKDIVGIAEGLPADSSVNHDHNLYGVPKK